MNTPRIDVAAVRRRQIVDAAVAIISEQGLQNLSLSEIEKKAAMSRGQLTYYFPAKEDILVAVFDRLMERMREQIEAEEAEAGPRLPPQGWARTSHHLEQFLFRTPKFTELGPLMYTFLSQVGHRDDFRSRLANGYEGWRRHIVADFGSDLAGVGASPQTFAALIQAIVIGLSVERDADPNAFDPTEMLNLLRGVLGSYVNRPGRSENAAEPTTPSTAATSRVRGRRTDEPSSRGEP
jgi:AcrR family transcriptional regulator